MPFAAHHLRVAFEGQGDYGFFAWTCSTHDSVETVLEEGYFRTTGDDLRRRDPMFVGISPRPPAREDARGRRRPTSPRRKGKPGALPGTGLFLDFAEAELSPS